MLLALRMSEKFFPFQKSAHQAAHHEAETAFDLTGKRAVVVEDEGVTLLQLRKILRSAGVEVVGIAANGRDAIEVVLNQRPDFVLMDIQMPIMDGLEAAGRILETFHVCIIMLTAFSDEEYQQKAREIGTGGYILKPITTEILLPQVEAALQKFAP